MVSIIIVGAVTIVMFEIRSMNLVSMNIIVGRLLITGSRLLMLVGIPGDTAGAIAT